MTERKFRTCVIGGYQKDDVLDYVEELEQELKELRERQGREEPSEDLNSLKEENQRLRDELEKVKEEQLQKSKEDDGKTMSLEPKQKEVQNSYEGSYVAAEQAILEAKAVLKEAREQAKVIRKQAEEEAKKRQSQIMEAFYRELETKGVSVLTTRYKLREQIEGLKEAREGLAQIRNHLEKAATQIPSETEDSYLECGRKE